MTRFDCSFFDTLTLDSLPENPLTYTGDEEDVLLYKAPS